MFSSVRQTILILVMIQICSFNCNSLKNSLTEVSELCSRYDLIFLQEIWLGKFELSSLNSIHNDFWGLGVTAFDSSNALLKGRPYGGIAILWRKTLQPSISVKAINERIMQINVTTDIGLVSLLNVYLPTDYRDMDSLDEFGMCIGQLAAVLDDISCSTCYYGIIGDCNANSYGSKFYTELSAFCIDQGLVISDVILLESGTSNVYTFVSAAHGSTSWIDHCLSSSPLHARIQSISVLCDITVSDHMPLVIELQLQPTAVVAPIPEPPRPPKLSWKSASVRSITAYNDLILQHLVSFYSDIIDDMYINCLANCV